MSVWDVSKHQRKEQQKARALAACLRQTRNVNFCDQSVLGAPFDFGRTPIHPTSVKPDGPEPPPAVEAQRLDQREPRMQSPWTMNASLERGIEKTKDGPRHVVESKYGIDRSLPGEEARRWRFISGIGFGITMAGESSGGFLVDASASSGSVELQASVHLAEISTQRRRVKWGFQLQAAAKVAQEFWMHPRVQPGTEIKVQVPLEVLLASLRGNHFYLAAIAEAAETATFDLDGPVREGQFQGGLGFKWKNLREIEALFQVLTGLEISEEETKGNVSVGLEIQF